MSRSISWLGVFTIVFVAILLSVGNTFAAGELTVWMKKGFVEQQNVEFEARVKAFADMKGIKVNTELIAYEDAFAKWTAAIESGNVPDISFFGYQEVGQFYQQGLLEDVTDVLAAIQKEYGAIFPKSIKAVTFEEKTYAIPFWGEGTALYYRKDLFQKAGLANPPDTWEQFREYAIKLTNPGEGVYGAGIGYGSGNSDAEWLSRSMTWAFGGSIFDESGQKIVFNSPTTLEAVNFISGLFMQDKVTPPTAMGWNDGGNNTAYISGQAAMVVNTGSIIKAIRNEHPDLLKQTGVVVLPKGKAGRFTAGISNNLGIFKGAKNKDLAKELLTFLLEPEWYEKWISVSAPLALPVFQKLAETELWQEEHHKAFLDSMTTFEFLGYKGSYTPKAGKIYNLRLINTMFENIIVKGMSAEDAVAAFTKEAEKILNE
jgi:multiple sugar transport system substrate-binding protein